MAWYDGLLQQGYVPDGAAPTIQQGVDESTTGRLLGALNNYQEKIKTDNADKQKEITNKLDMYKTLRDAGYDPQKAYDAVHSDKFVWPDKAPDATPTDKLKAAQADAMKAKADYYKNLGGANDPNAIPNNTKALTFKILSKLSNGETLLPGEQQVYNDYIKKYGSKSALETALGSDPAGGGNAVPVAPKAAAAPKAPSAPKVKAAGSDYIPMTDPAGNAKKVHPEDVDKALKLGWTKRG